MLTLEVADGLSERERLSTGTKWKPGRISWYPGWKGCMMDARYWSIVVGNKGRLTFTWLSGSVPIEQESIAQFWWIIWIPAKNKWFTALIVAKLSLSLSLNNERTYQTQHRDWFTYLGCPKTSLTTVNVTGFSFVLCDVSMEIYLGKFSVLNCGYTHQTQFTMMVKGSFATVKLPRVTAPIVSALQHGCRENPLYSCSVLFLVDVFCR